MKIHAQLTFSHYTLDYCQHFVTHHPSLHKFWVHQWQAPKTFNLTSSVLYLTCTWPSPDHHLNYPWPLLFVDFYKFQHNHILSSSGSGQVKVRWRWKYQKFSDKSLTLLDSFLALNVSFALVVVTYYPQLMQLPFLLQNLSIPLQKLALQTPHLGFQQRVFVHWAIISEVHNNEAIWDVKNHLWFSAPFPNQKQESWEVLPLQLLPWWINYFIMFKL